MPRVTKTEQELGFLRSFWDEVRELEADFNGSVTVYETASPRPGVLSVRLVFTQIVGKKENPLPTCSYTYSFPSAANTTYAASKWVATRALRQVVEDSIQPVQAG